MSWKYIVIGIDETNNLSKIIKSCVAMVAYTIYSQWVLCNFENTNYGKVNLTVVVKAKMKFYAQVLQNTKRHKVLGRKISLITKNL